MPYGTPERIGIGYFSWKAAIGTVGEPSILSGSIELQMNSELTDPADEALADAKFQAFVDLINASPDFELVAAAPELPTAYKQEAYLLAVTPTPPPEETP